MSSCIVRTESLGGSKLSRAARDGQLRDWYVPAPSDRAAWVDYAARVRASVNADWFEQLHDAIAPSGRAAARLEQSAGGRGLVVTTGQQPGLFGGPLMSLVKAISARALADTLQEMLNMPVAPVFWAATDDADFDEASVVSVSLDGGARELCLEPGAPTGTPMARVPMGDDVLVQAEYLREASGSAPHAAFLDLALDAYRPGVTVGDAYLTLLRAVLEPIEIAVLDASHPSVARAGDALLRRAVSRAAAVADAVRARSEAIVARGFSPQVDEVRGLSLVFLNSNGTKRRLAVADAATLGSLTEHEFLSSTVLLRPVLERAILPTATYVGGPGEYAYFSQVTAVADALETPAPMVMPRWSASLIEPRIARLLEGLSVAPEALADPNAVENLIARRRLSPDADAALHALRGATVSGVDALRAANDGLVPDAVLDGLQRSIEHRVQRAERRFLAGVKRRETDVMRQIGTVRGALYPHGAPQERKLAYIAFLARYGSELVDDMLEAARGHARALVADTPSLGRPSSSAPARV